MYIFSFHVRFLFFRLRNIMLIWLVYNVYKVWRFLVLFCLVYPALSFRSYRLLTELTVFSCGSMFEMKIESP